MAASIIAAVSATHGYARGASPELPQQIRGNWKNEQWGGPWVLTNFNLEARTATATLGRGGDSCGFSNANAVIRKWEGNALEIEVKSRNCKFPVLFRLTREGTAWTGVVENDVRTVQASGKE